MISFIRIPLKISKYESNLNKITARMRRGKIVTGTEFDLRKLPMKFVHNKLKERGYTEEVLQRLERWDKIELLREIANKMILNYTNRKNTQKDQDYDQQIMNFARTLRITTEQQKERYVDEMNDIFSQICKNLASMVE